MDGSDGGATVTPIRPEIQLADTTPFVASSLPTLPPDDGTWGVSHHRRMQAEEPDHPAITEPRVGAASQPAFDDPLPDGLPDDTYARDEPGAIRQAGRRQVHGRITWSNVAALALIALLGGAFAVITAAHNPTPRAPLPRLATLRQQPAMLSSLPAPRALSQPHAATQQRVTRQIPPRRSKLRRTRLRYHITQGEAPSSTTATSYPSSQPVYAPTTQRPQTTETVNGTSSAPSTSSAPNTSASQPPSPRPPAPAGPTGNGALLGSGHCSC